MVISGGQEVGRSRQGGKESRPLGIGVDSAKGLRGRDEFRGAAEYVLGFSSFVLWSSISAPFASSSVQLSLPQCT